ncbi:GNAT family N-acetyltransferase [Micromonospora sp. BRA006-A]|nr:GNAT family N-acetyltransferase [Micromonospora sp. BRA006-A]
MARRGIERTGAHHSPGGTGRRRGDRPGARPRLAGRVRRDHARGGADPAEPPRLGAAPPRPRHRRPEHPFTTLVAEDGGTIVGFTTFGPYRNNQDRGDLDPAHGELLAIYLEPAHWGLGRRADAARGGARRAGRAGWTGYRLWVLAANARARRFYERAGHLPDGEESTYPVPLSGGRTPILLRELRYTAGG